MFISILSSDPDIKELPFGKKVDQFFKDLKPSLEIIEAKMDEVNLLFEKTCDYYMIEKDDEKRK